VHLLIGSIGKKWVFHVSLVFGESFGEFLMLKMDEASSLPSFSVFDVENN